MEHCVLFTMYLLDLLVPDLPGWIASEKQGQRQWLDLRAMPDTSQVRFADAAGCCECGDPGSVASLGGSGKDRL